MQHSARDASPAVTQTVYVELLDEGVDVWRPVEAESDGDAVVRLPDHAPEGEQWAFPPGSRVRWEQRRIGKVAVELA
jgi:hypothetical protein